MFTENHKSTQLTETFDDMAKTPFLHDYQLDLLHQVKEHFVNDKIVLLAGTTGVGKTEITAEFIIQNSSARFLILAHGMGDIRENFYQRLLGKAELAGQVVALIGSRHANAASKARIVVTLPQSASKCMDRLGAFDYVVVDEAHQFYNAPMYDVIFSHHKGPRLLLTASHYQIQDVKKVFFSRQKALEVGRIDNVTTAIQPVILDLTEGSYTADDEVRKEIETLAPVEAIAKFLTPKHLPAMVATRSIKEAKNLLKELNKIPELKGRARVSDSESDKDSSVISEFKDGEFPICIVVNRGQIGFDYEDLITFIDASYSLNVMRIEQAVGRVSRRHPEGKEKLYLKLTPSGVFSNTVLALTAVQSLGYSPIYESWDGNYKKLKIRLPKDINEVVPDWDALVAEVSSIEERTSKVSETLIGTSPASIASIPARLSDTISALVPEGEDSSFQMKKKAPPAHLLASFGQFVGMFEGDTGVETDFKSAQVYIQRFHKYEKESPWLAFRTTKEWATWVEVEINPKSLSDWKNRHPGSHSCAIKRGIAHEVLGLMNISLATKNPENRKQAIKDFYALNGQFPTITGGSEEKDLANSLVHYCKIAAKDQGFRKWARNLGYGTKTSISRKQTIKEFFVAEGRLPRGVPNNPTERKLAASLAGYINKTSETYDSDFASWVASLGISKIISSESRKEAIKDFFEKNSRLPSRSSKDIEERKLGEGIKSYCSSGETYDADFAEWAHALGYANRFKKKLS